MDKQSSSRVPTNRQPLGDATWRVNHGAADRAAGPRQSAHRQPTSPAMAKKQDRGRSNHHPKQSENRPPLVIEPVSTDNRHSNMDTAHDSFDPALVAAKRASQFSNMSSSASSIRARKTHIGPWQLGKTLGKGSSARVRQARHRDTHELAAVKIVAKQTAHLTQAGSLAKLDKIENGQPVTANGVRRIPLAIEREVAIMKLIEHPNIVKMYDIWENRSEIYLVLEFVEKGDLFEFINWQGRLREEEAVFYFRQIMSAIQYCHSLNICHRDLKPENILLNSDGQVKIADFGMAALHQSPGHHLRTACGSPHYAAPELLKQRMYKGESADVWSMGVILFAMLAGRLPFDEPDLHDMLARAKKADYQMPQFLSLEAKDLIYRILQVEPHHRISMAQMWKHPLIAKYDYLDELNENGGQPPDIRRDVQLAPLKEADMDPQILRQLRSVWHTFSEQDLKSKLLNDKPNDEKLFYRLLYNYREAQMENYNPGLAPSASDFHHLRPPNWGKRISTCQFSQPGRNGHLRNVSRFTVISNVAETEAGTVQSYDPYNASRVLHPCNSQASHAKVTIHRNGSEPDTSAELEPDVVSHSYRSRKSVGGSLNQKKRVASQRATTASQLLSPPGTMSSIQSGRNGTPRVRPNARHKRGVDFSAMRKRSEETPLRRSSDRNRRGPASIAGDNTTFSRENLSPSSPRKKSLRRGPTTSMAEVPEDRDDSVIWNEELKQLGHKIAEHCDEAFRSSLMSSASDEEFNGQREMSPLSLTLDSPSTSQGAKPASLTNPGHRTSLQPWDARPLPSVPAHGPNTPEHRAVTDPFKGKTSGTYADATGGSSPQSPDRRIVSAPVYSQYSREVGQLPSIYETTLESWTQCDPSKGRTVSAPADSAAPLPSPHENQGLDYLARVENSIRVVNSPSGPQPFFDTVEAPEPLKLRKKSPSGVPEPQESNGRCSRLDMREPLPVNGRQESAQSEIPLPSQGSQTLGGIKKKTSSWFKRSSKVSVNDASIVADKTVAPKETSLVVNKTTSQSTTETITPVTAKKKFSLTFWKTVKTEPKMSLAGPAYCDKSNPETETRLKGQASRPGASPGIASNAWLDKEASGRKIDIQQNWLARLFRVKPATRYLCFTIPKRRARQEVAILLKEWRKYGMTDIEVDKARDTVFARVSPDNYLNIKEVSFAAEVMAVIEHGKRNHLSIVRVTQERGAASSFHKVVETMNSVFNNRSLLVTDHRKAKMMVKTLNS